MCPVESCCCLPGIDEGKVRVTVHQLVKNLQGDVLSDGEVLHVFTVNRGLIAGMDLGDESDPAAGPSCRIRTSILMNSFGVASMCRWERPSSVGALRPMAAADAIRQPVLRLCVDKILNRLQRS